MDTLLLHTRGSDESQSFAEAGALRMRELELRQRLWLRIVIVLVTGISALAGAFALDHADGPWPIVGLVGGGFTGFALSFSYYTEKRIQAAAATMFAAHLKRL